MSGWNNWMDIPGRLEAFVREDFEIIRLEIGLRWMFAVLRA